MKLPLRLAAAAILALGIGQSATVLGIPSTQPLFFTPAASAVPEVIAAIKAARSSIHMIMYRISETAIIEALIEAHSRGVEVNVILDKNSADREKPNGAFARLTAAGVKVLKSSPGFSLSHIKTFVVDSQVAYIMTLNLTTITAKVRDVGYITNDPSTIQFFLELYAMDVQNAADKTAKSPANIPEHVVLSPKQARGRLIEFLKTARKSVMLTVENFSDTAMMAQLVELAKQGVKVQALMPRCDLTANDFDMPAARTLSAGGVEVRMMPAPMSAENPYIHQKSIVVDEDTVFLGSENFTFNSLDRGREFGVIFSDAPQVRQMVEQYREDFAKSLDMPGAEAFACPKNRFDDKASGGSGLGSGMLLE